MSEIKPNSPKINFLLAQLSPEINRMGKSYIAEKSGVSRPEVWRILKGNVSAKLETFLALANSVGYDLILVKSHLRDKIAERIGTRIAQQINRPFESEVFTNLALMELGEVNWTADELKVIEDLGKRLELSSTQVLRQALRNYQLQIVGEPDLLKFEE